MVGAPEGENVHSIPYQKHLFKVERTAGGVKATFPLLGGELHEADSDKEREAQPEEPKGGIIDKRFTGSAGQAGWDRGMEGGTGGLVH